MTEWYYIVLYLHLCHKKWHFYSNFTFFTNLFWFNTLLEIIWPAHISYHTLPAQVVSDSLTHVTMFKSPLGYSTVCCTCYSYTFFFQGLKCFRLVWFWFSLYSHSLLYIIRNKGSYRQKKLNQFENFKPHHIYSVFALLLIIMFKATWLS